MGTQAWNAILYRITAVIDLQNWLAPVAVQYYTQTFN